MGMDLYTILTYTQAITVHLLNSERQGKVFDFRAKHVNFLNVMKKYHIVNFISMRFLKQNLTTAFLYLTPLLISIYSRA